MAEGRTNGAKLCKRLWLLENSFDGFSAQNLLCKSLNFRSAEPRKFAEITALVPFSTATGYFNTQDSILRIAAVPRGVNCG